MNLLFHLNSLIDTYRRVRQSLTNHDGIIFDAMADVTRNASHAFVSPVNPGEYEQKHAEIENKLRFPDALQGKQIAFRLMQQIWNRVQNQGGIPGLSNSDLLERISFDTKEKVFIKLTSDSHWAAEWRLRVSSSLAGDVVEEKTALHIYDSTWNEIVPTYIIQYVHTAIFAYQQGLNATAVALLSICIEATLRDVLAARGYTFTHGASSVDVYPYINADVGVSGNAYTINILDAVPKNASDWLVSTGGAATLRIQIRRIVKKRDVPPDRIDIAILTPSALLDHWSSSTPSQTASRTVGGLGEALRIARYVENTITAADLPPDFDDVIKAVRNNLIHLSGDALNTQLLDYDPTGGFTLGDFLNDQGKVYDLVWNIPRFINEQYIALRRAAPAP